MIDSEEARITTRHKRKLEHIREEHQHDRNNKDDRGHLAPGQQEDGSPVRANQQDSGSSVGGDERISSEPGVAGRSDRGIRSADDTAVNTASGYDRVARGAEENYVKSQAELEAERERERELNRQRQQRYRDRHRNEGNFATTHEAFPFPSPPLPERSGGAPNVTRNADITQAAGVTFKSFQKELAEPVKLLTIKEAEDAKERLVFLFVQGSSLLDDVLEIIVKDHEPTKIWELDEDEANMLAELQLEKAKKDKAAARTVRLLLRIYERLYWIMLVKPRLIASTQHVMKHKGFGFR